MNDNRKSFLKSPNFWIIIAVLVVIAALLVIAPKNSGNVPENLVQGDTESVSIETATEEPTAMPTAAAVTAEPEVQVTDAPATEEPSSATDAPAENAAVPTVVSSDSAEATADSTEYVSASAEVTAVPSEAVATETAAPAENTEIPYTQTGYILVYTNSETRAFPVYSDYEYEFSVVQHPADGTDDVINVIHVSQNGVYMASSTCENQDCVDEGEVTLQNKGTRVLANMIICMPNEVMIELYTVEEVEAMIAESQTQATDTPVPTESAE